LNFDYVLELDLVRWRLFVFESKSVLVYLELFSSDHYEDPKFVSMASAYGSNTLTLEGSDNVDEDRLLFLNSVSLLLASA
jgi:hypothetical protein